MHNKATRQLCARKCLRELLVDTEREREREREREGEREREREAPSTIINLTSLAPQYWDTSLLSS